MPLFWPDPEYMKMKLKIIPQEIIDQYQLQDLEKDGWVYMKIVKGIPGLKQADRLANERLVHNLAPYGYAPVQHTPYLWKHESKGILFALMVDDFLRNYLQFHLHVFWVWQERGIKKIFYIGCCEFCTLCRNHIVEEKFDCG